MLPLLIAMLLTLPSALCLAQVTPTPLAHWPMDEKSGITVSDAIGRHDGTALIVSAIIDGPDGGSDKARDLGNKDGYILVPDSPAWNLGYEFTIAVWVYPRSVPGSIVTRYNPVGNRRSISMDLDGRRLRLIVNQGGGGNGANGNSPRTADDSITLNEWQHLTATFNRGRIRLYRNGILLSDSLHPATSVVSAAIPLLLGGYVPNDVIQPNLDGALGDVQIFGTELGPDDIRRLYEKVVDVEETAWGAVKALFR